MKKTRQNAIEWCGPCWIDNKRVLAVGRIGPKNKLPVCSLHHDELEYDPTKAREIFEVWDAMPNFSTGAESMEHFMNLVSKVVTCPPKH
jgi:hypothetical protein